MSGDRVRFRNGHDERARWRTEHGWSRVSGDRARLREKARVMRGKCGGDRVSGDRMESGVRNGVKEVQFFGTE